MLKYVDNDVGYSIIRCSGFYEATKNIVLSDINNKAGTSFETIEEAGTFISEYEFESFKQKKNRILPQEIAERFVLALESSGICGSSKYYITDEENLGYPNFYWRIVRPNSNGDVGPIHADGWFWELRKWQFPPSHRRVKVWMPLVQDDTDSSLLVVPNSHLSKFNYITVMDTFGLPKPKLSNDERKVKGRPSSVKTGECIVFHDLLLHKGRSTRRLRLSIEFTVGVLIE